ncbi:uncharacterized protein [Epargyreus clarus]|uniref:uncharacterized protein n=1 Tax=Epargyreus clarus TaxID=520877 RepID=UPI003C2B5900
MEMEIDDTHEECAWDLCPKEILIKIFKHLEPKDLLTCMHVSNMWRTIAEYCGQTFDTWSLLVKNHMHNRGTTFRQKSLLSNRNLYLNSRMWCCVDKAKVKLKHVYNLKDVLKIHVYKGSLIVVCKHSVKYFNLEDGQIINEIKEECLDYQETDFLVAKITLHEGNKQISLFSKRHKTYECSRFKIYAIQDNKCIVINSRICAIYYECQHKCFKKRVFGRYYSDSKLLTAMFVYMDDMYLFVRNGNVFRYEHGDSHFKKFCTLQVPDPEEKLVQYPPEVFMTMFHKCSVVYGVQNKEKEGLTKTLDHMTLLYADVNCALEHGDVLLLGFKDGKVGIVNVKKFWSSGDVSLDFEFYVQDMIQGQDVEPITNLEVYEDENCHHVFVSTSSNLYQFLIYQPDYNKVML